MTKSYIRGYEIEFINTEWVYSDNKQPTAETHKYRPCYKCRQMPTKEDHDACLGTLPGVMNACCGHGQTPYIQFMDGFCVRGQDAETIIEILKKHRKV